MQKLAVMCSHGYNCKEENTGGQMAGPDMDMVWVLEKDPRDASMSGLDILPTRKKITVFPVFSIYEIFSICCTLFQKLLGMGRLCSC